MKSRRLSDTNYAVPHELGKRLPGGKYELNHPEGCGCEVIYSVNHAKWISYNAIRGQALCDHCKAVLDLPMPAVRENRWSKRVYMELRGIEDDLWNFQQKHEACPPPPSDSPCAHRPADA